MATWLSLVFVAHAGHTAGGAWINTRRNTSRDRGQESWAVLCGHWASRERTRRARLTPALDHLESATLVSLTARGAQGRYGDFDLLSDSGAASRYQVPAADSPDVLQLPGNVLHPRLAPGPDPSGDRDAARGPARQRALLGTL